MKQLFVLIFYNYAMVQAIEKETSILGSNMNVWLTWANKTGVTDFCLTLAQVGNPFQTCLIGVPYLNPLDFQGWVKNPLVLNSTTVTEMVKRARGTDWTIASAQLGAIIKNLNHSTIPMQELQLLGSDKTNQSCITFHTWSSEVPETRVTSEKTWYHNITAYCSGSSPALRYSDEIPKALPPGYFLICRDRAWPGIPSKPFGGPCYLGKLSLFAASKRQLVQDMKGSLHRDKRSIEQLGPNCDSTLTIWNHTARFLTALFVPNIAAGKALKDIHHLACWAAKQLNITSDIISSLATDTDSVRHASLQNRAAIDFLLLAHGHGVCSIISKSCCSYIDQSGRIETYLEEIWKQTKIFHEMAVDDTACGFEEIWKKLTSWLPNLSWLRQLVLSPVSPGAAIKNTCLSA
uniref:Uncharacterized protein n=1 Tax=Melopsittacus undulatus TaxID=13146 RepID=A0A8V5GUB1_MELUD